MSFTIKAINIYQKYISPLTGSNCRFYPTCSEYSKWLFANSDIITAYSPLEGFLVQEDYLSVLDDMRLSNDIPWTIPIVLDVSPEEIAGVREGDDIALYYQGEPLALMRVEEIYGWDKKEYAASAAV
jgi:hypothetical protein